MARGTEDWRFVAAGAAAAAIMPGLVFGLGAPLWAGLIGAGAAFGGLVLVMSPKSRPKPSGGRAAVVAKAVGEAEPALDRIEAAAGRIRDKAVRKRVTAIAGVGRTCIAELEESPASLGTVQRLLTYYIPRAAELSEGFAEMEARGLGEERRRSISDLLVKLEEAFGHYRDQLADEELRALDVDIRLVGEALEEDIGGGPAASRPTGRRS